VGRDGPDGDGRDSWAGRPPAEAGPGRTGEEIEEAGAVVVLFFAGAREAAGTARAVLPAAGSTLAHLLGRLGQAYGGRLEAVLPNCSVWVNRSPAAPGLVLRDGDEVALMPPVSGG
jgi:molybdopterin converting factor small subunit